MSSVAADPAGLLTGELIWATVSEGVQARAAAPARLCVPASSMVVIGGPVGAGKSTLLRRLGGEQFVTVSLDELRRDEQQRRGLPRDEYHPRCWSNALHEFDRVMREHLAAGENVVCDLTAVDPGPIASLVALARPFGRPALAVYVDGSLRMCLDGQTGRTAPIDPVTVRDYVRSWERLRATMATQGFRDVGWDGVAVLDRPAADTLAQIDFV